jgi:hypothetical protein
MAHDTVVAVADENTITIDGESYEFDPTHVEFDPTGPILSARRDAEGTLVLNILLKYRIDQEAQRQEWETPRADGTYRGHGYETIAPGTTVGVYEEAAP